MLRSQRIDGLILAPTGTASMNRAALLAALEMPVVLVDRAMEGLGYDAVVLNNHRAAYEAASYAIGRGHRRIALINGPKTVRTAADRLQGYREALLAAGLAFDPALVKDAGFREQSANEAALQLLRGDKRPTAIFTTNNLMTIGVLRATAEFGPNCPDDISIIGIDDLPWPGGRRPASHHGRATGSRHGRDRARSAGPAHCRHSLGSGTTTVMEPRLMVRNSCALRRQRPMPRPPMSEGFIELGALAAHRLLVSGELTSVELVDAAARRIAAVEPAVNALPTLCLERARAQAQSADRARRAGEKTLLGGLPIVVKDNNDVGGVRTTGGSRFSRRGSPRFRTAPSRNSYSTALSCSANPICRNSAAPRRPTPCTAPRGIPTTPVSHAADRRAARRWPLPLARRGSRTAMISAAAYGFPAAFCNVTGLRPTPGRVPRKRLANPFDTMAVEGPMARDVADLAFMFDAMVGFDPGHPLTSPNSEPPFLDAAASPHKPDRLAMSVDLGELPISDDIRIAMAALMRLFEPPASRSRRIHPTSRARWTPFWRCAGRASSPHGIRLWRNTAASFPSR